MSLTYSIWFKLLTNQISIQNFCQIKPCSILVKSSNQAACPPLVDVNLGRGQQIRGLSLGRREGRVHLQGEGGGVLQEEEEEEEEGVRKCTSPGGGGTLPWDTPSGGGRGKGVEGFVPSYY